MRASGSASVTQPSGEWRLPSSRRADAAFACLAERARRAYLQTAPPASVVGAPLLHVAVIGFRRNAYALEHAPGSHECPH